MEEGRRYKVIDLERREEQIKDGKKDLAKGVLAAAISGVCFHYANLAGNPVPFDVQTVMNGLLPSLGGGAALSAAVIEVIEGMKKLVKPELVEVSEELMNMIEEEKGRGTK